jgi:hypothetical protein
MSPEQYAARLGPTVIYELAEDGRKTEGDRDTHTGPD